jgi:RNA polymerase sigma-70 factor, ECF subfamily
MMPPHRRTADERARQRARLMERVQDGDRQAYRELLEDIGPVVLEFARRRVADRHEVEDVAQETLIALHRARHTYDPARPFEPWLFAIARNVVADYHRRRMARLSSEVIMEGVPEPPAETPDTGDAQLADALRKLPASQREAFEMLKLEGLSVEAAAGRAGVTEGALKVRAHRAYKAIKARLRG